MKEGRNEGNDEWLLSPLFVEISHSSGIASLSYLFFEVPIQLCSELTLP